MSDHPTLPAGYNTTDNDGDMIDGPGVNWDVWPVLLDAAITLTPLVITPDMMAAFDGCPDLVVEDDNFETIVPGVNDLIVIAPEIVLWTIDDDGWGTITVPPESWTLTLPADLENLMISEDSANYERGS